MSTESVYRKNAADLNQMFGSSGSVLFQTKSLVGIVFAYVGAGDKLISEIYGKTISAMADVSKDPALGKFPYAVACWQVACNHTPLGRLQGMVQSRAPFRKTTLDVHPRVFFDFEPAGSILSVSPDGECPVRRHRWEDGSTQQVVDLSSHITNAEIYSIHVAQGSGAFFVPYRDWHGVGILECSSAGKYLGCAQTNNRSITYELSVCPNGTVFAFSQPNFPDQTVKFFRVGEERPFNEKTYWNTTSMHLEMFADGNHFATIRNSKVEVFDLNGTQTPMFTCDQYFPRDQNMFTRVVGDSVMHWHEYFSVFDKKGKALVQRGRCPLEVKGEIFFNSIPLAPHHAVVSDGNDRLRTLWLVDLQKQRYQHLSIRGEGRGLFPIRVLGNGCILEALPFSRTQVIHEPVIGEDRTLKIDEAPNSETVSKEQAFTVPLSC